jgi:hypothetical protein
MGSIPGPHGLPIKMVIRFLAGACRSRKAALTSLAAANVIRDSSAIRSGNAPSAGGLSYSVDILHRSCSWSMRGVSVPIWDFNRERAGANRLDKVAR